MLTLANFVLPADPPGPAWLWQPPSLYTLVDLTVTGALLVGLLILARRRRVGVTPREWARMVARLDSFELSASQREARDQSFRTDMIEVNESLLKERRQQNDLLTKMLSRTEYVANTLDSRPCVLNEATNGDDDCPEGHE